MEMLVTKFSKGKYRNEGELFSELISKDNVKLMGEMIAFLDFQPLSAVVSEKDSLCRYNRRQRLLDLQNGRTFIESGKPVHKAFAHGLKIPAGP